MVSFATVKVKDSGGFKMQLPGPWRTRHWQCLFLFVALVVAYVNHVCISVVIIAIREEQDRTDELSTQNIGIILSSFMWGNVLMHIPFGYLARIWSGKIVISVSILISGLISILCPVAFDQGGWMFLCVGRFIMGLSQAGITPCTHTLLAKWVPPNERGLLAPLTYAGTEMGVAVAYATSGVLAYAAGWRSVFYIFGATSIVFSLILCLVCSDSPAESRKNRFCRISEAEREFIERSLPISDGELAKGGTRSTTPWKAILTSKPFWALFLVHCTDFWGFSVLLNEIPIYLAAVLELDLEESGMTAASSYFILVLLTIPSSYLSKWSEKSGLSRGTVRKIWNTVGQCGTGLAVLSICFLPPGNTTLPVVLLVIAVGFDAASNCAYQINHMDLSPKYAGLLVSITRTAAMIVSFLGPLVVGQIVTDLSNADQWQIVFFITAGVCFVGNLIFVLFGSGETQSWNA